VRAAEVDIVPHRQDAPRRSELSAPRSAVQGIDFKSRIVGKGDQTGGLGKGLRFQGGVGGEGFAVFDNRQVEPELLGDRQWDRRQ